MKVRLVYQGVSGGLWRVWMGVRVRGGEGDGDGDGESWVGVCGVESGDAAADEVDGGVFVGRVRGRVSLLVAAVLLLCRVEGIEDEGGTGEAGGLSVSATR